jgi:hypothetical protein
MKRDQKASRADLFTPARTLCHRRASIIQKHIVRDSLQPRCENIGRLPRWFDLSHAISRDPPAGCQEHCSSHVCKFRSSTLIAGQLRLCPLRLKGASQAPTGCILKWYIHSKDTSTFSPKKRREHQSKQVNPFNPFIMQVKHFVGIFIISVGLGQGLALPSNHSSLLIKRRACAIEEIQNRDPGVISHVLSIAVSVSSPYPIKSAFILIQFFVMARRGTVLVNVSVNRVTGQF